MKCKEERCKCGQDLTGIVDIEPTMWTVVDGERVPYVECPRCRSYCILVEPEPEPEPEPEAPSEPEASSEPVVEPEPAPGTAEPEA